MFDFSLNFFCLERKGISKVEYVEGKEESEI